MFILVYLMCVMLRVRACTRLADRYGDWPLVTLSRLDFLETYMTDDHVSFRVHKIVSHRHIKDSFTGHRATGACSARARVCVCGALPPVYLTSSNVILLATRYNAMAIVNPLKTKINLNYIKYPVRTAQ